MNTKVNDKIFDTFPILESERLLFRAYELSDAPDLFAIKSNKKVMELMDSSPHTSVADTEKLIHRCHKDFEEKNGITWAIIEKTSNEFIGYFCFWRIDRAHCRGEIGYSLKPASWGKGYMSETMARLIKFAFHDLKIHSIEANTNPKNEASKKLLLKSGFKQEAYFRENYFFDGRFLDSVIFSLVE